MEPIVAIIYDCDDTLCRDTTEFLLHEYGIDVDLFWQDIGKRIEQGWDPTLAYLTRIVELVEEGPLKGLTKQRLREIGAKVPLFPGLPEMFKELNRLVSRNARLKDIGLRLEHYIVSGGIAELIRGLQIARYMKDIFGCEFSFDSKTMIPIAVKSSVSFTEKTKFIWAINKNISGSLLRRKPYVVNNVISKEKRRIPLHNMIYIGDGPSDIPCFSMIADYGGDGIGVAEKPTKGYELAKGKRTTTGPYSPNYQRDSDMRRALEAAILDKAYGIYVDLQRGQRRGPSP